MEETYPHGTLTLARLFASQGHYGKAAEIYRRLLAREPGRQEIAQALAEAEERIKAGGETPPGDLEALFREWIDLLLQYDRLRKLRRIKKAL